MPIRTRVLATLAGVLLLLTPAACGRDQGGAQPPGSTKVTMTDFKFEPRTISVPSGKTLFFLVNPGSSGHDMVISRDEAGRQAVARSPFVAAGDSATFAIENLAAGVYFFRCDVPGHAESGMTGTLTVK